MKTSPLRAANALSLIRLPLLLNCTITRADFGASDVALSDGAAVVLLSSDAWAKQRGIPVLAHLTAWETAAVDYLRVCGHLVFAYFWARMARIALNQQGGGNAFYAAKLMTARFYFAKLLPETAGLIRSARAGMAPLMAMDEALF